jgi:predicted  nucleic acid-binding Zn-ribbon protein
MMFQCNYCGGHFLEHKTNCPNCGALIKIVSVEEIDQADGMHRTAAREHAIRAICVNFEEIRNLHIDETMTAKRRKTVYDSLSIPTNETLIMVYDDTLMGSNKTGFAICQGGLYWKNDWATTSKRNFLTWQAFAERSISLDGYAISLGRGDRLGTAGVGDKHAREQMVIMLNEIKALLNG